MPRSRRVVVRDCAHHVTQRGNHRCVVFGDDQDREIYLDLVRENARLNGVSVLGYCLMPNHVHWIVTPQDEDGLAATFGQAQGRYSLYFQTRRGTSGHLWQRRYYSCVLGMDHLVRAMRYVEMNPVRAGMVGRAEEYWWSSARAHIEGWDRLGMLDLAAWEKIVPVQEWKEILAGAAEREDWKELEKATYSGKPYGDEQFQRRIGMEVGRDLTRKRGRPRKWATGENGENGDWHHFLQSEEGAGVGAEEVMKMGKW